MSGMDLDEAPTRGAQAHTVDLSQRAVDLTNQALQPLTQRPEFQQFLQRVSPSQLDGLARAASQPMTDGSYGNRDQFMERLTQAAPQMSQQQRDEIWLLLNQALTPLTDQRVTSAYAAGNAEEGRAWQEFSSSSCQHRYRAGETDQNGTQRNLVDIQSESLARQGVGLTETQQGDMLRGAALAGYSAEAVYAAQFRLQGAQLRQQGRNEDDFSEAMVAAQISLQVFMRDNMIRVMNDLRNIEQRARLADPRDDDIKRERETAVASLARLMGGTQPRYSEAEDAGRQDPTPGVVNGERVADVTIARILNETDAQRALHAHQLDRTVPRHVA